MVTAQDETLRPHLSAAALHEAGGAAASYAVAMVGEHVYHGLEAFCDQAGLDVAPVSVGAAALSTPTTS